MALTKKEPAVRSVYKPMDKEYKTLRHVYDRKQRMGDKRVEYEKNWDRWEKAWEGYRPPRSKDDWQSDIYIPITTSTIEAMMSEIVNQDLKPWAVGRGVEDQPKATIVNNTLEYTWDVSKSDVALFDIIHDALVCGTGIGQEYFWHEERNIRNSDGQGTDRVVEFDDCYLEPVKLYDFYVDERARSFFGPYGAEDCIRRYVMDYEAFRNFFQGKVWDPMGNASLVKPGGDTSYYEFFKPPERMDHSREVEVLWYWNKPDDLLAVVANDVMVKMGPNPYKHKQLPFARAVDVRRTHQFYGKGEAELLDSLQEEINTMRRMLIDRHHLDIDKPILTSDSLTIDDEDTVAAPHKVIPVGDVNQVKFPEYQDIALSVYKSLEMMNDDRVRLTGLDERQQSVQAGGTATEAAILKEATLKRLNMKIWNIKNDFLVDIGRLRVSNILQFYSQPKLEKIIGEKGTDEYKAKVEEVKSKGQLVMGENGDAYQASYRNIRLKDKAMSYNSRTGGVAETPAKGYTFFQLRPEFFLPTHGGFDIRYKASSSLPISKPLQQQKMLDMYDRLSKNPTVDPWKLAESVLKSLELDPDEFKYVPPQQKQNPDSVNMQKLVELAGMENQQMLAGKVIPPTPYAPPFHTELHVEFMKSEEFKKMIPPEDDTIVKNFSRHVMGELIAQKARGGEAGTIGGSPGMPAGIPGSAPAPGSEGGQNMMGAAVMPGIAQGGGEMPPGMRGAETGIQTGRNT